jgi:hypothetical protein
VLQRAYRPRATIAPSYVEADVHCIVVHEVAIAHSLFVSVLEDLAGEERRRVACGGRQTGCATVRDYFKQQFTPELERMFHIVDDLMN